MRLPPTEPDCPGLLGQVGGSPFDPAGLGSTDRIRPVGLRLRERYQDWDRGPFTGESQDHIWVCEVTAAPAG